MPSGNYYRLHRRTAVYTCGHLHKEPSTSTRKLPRPCDACVNRSPSQPSFWKQVVEQSTRPIVVLSCGHFGPPGSASNDVCRICNPQPERFHCRHLGVRVCNVCNTGEFGGEARNWGKQRGEALVPQLSEPVGSKPFLRPEWERARVEELENELVGEERHVIRTAVVKWGCGHYAPETYTGQALVVKGCENCRLNKGAKARVRAWLKGMDVGS